MADKLTPTELADKLEHLERERVRTLKDMQLALSPSYHVERATHFLRLAGELTDKALAILDNVANAQRTFEDLRTRSLVLSLVIAHYGPCKTQDDIRELTTRMSNLVTAMQRGK